jgi:hypothetical protein
MLLDDVIHDAVRLRLLRGHNEITFHVLLNLFKRLARMKREKLVERVASPEDFPGVDIDVSSLAGKAGHPGLVDENSGVGQGIAFFRCACDEKQCCNRGRLADAISHHIGAIQSDSDTVEKQAIEDALNGLTVLKRWTVQPPMN